MDSKMKTDSEDCSEVSLVELTTETYLRSHEIGVSMKPEMNENHFSEEHGPGDIHENSQPESSLMVSSNEYQREMSFQSATDDTFNIINNDTAEINDVSVDGKVVGANVENDTEVIVKDFQSSDLLQSEEQSSDLFRNNSDDVGETGKIEGEINSNIKLYEEHNKSTGIAADSHEEQDAQLSVNAAEDFSSKHTPHSSTNTVPSAQLNSAVEDDTTGEPVQDQSNNNLVKLGSSGIDTSADSLEAQDAQLLVKAIEDLASKYTSNSFINAETSAIEDNSDELTRVTAVPLPVQDQSVNNLTKLTSPGTEASVDSGSRRDSLDGNWGSSSVISMISDAPAVLDGETLPSTGPQASTEASKSDVNIPQAAPADRQLSGKSETFELPSFTTLVEPSHVAASNGAAAASEIQNPQQSNSTSQAAWFPTLNQVINEPQGRKKNEETISKITKRSSSKEHTPLKSLL
ncbi:serine-rich adhesin for platelets-like, partial [Trifolium medium]|nr:serine-rich adhesin for platelets-like [Trifolium medium]